MEIDQPDFFDVYVTLVKSPPQEEIPIREFSSLIHCDYEELLEDLLYDKVYDGICTCEFENPQDPTLDEIDECPCVPELVRKEDIEVRIDDDDNAFMTCRELASALLEMENGIGEEIREYAYNLVFNVIEDATGVNREAQIEHLDTAVSHCTEDDETPLTSLLERTMEQVRSHLNQNP